MRTWFTQPSAELFSSDSEDVDSVAVGEHELRAVAGGLAVYVSGEKIAQYAPGSLTVEGHVRGDAQGSFTLSHHAMSEAGHAWGELDGRALAWTGAPLTFSHTTGLRNTSFKGRGAGEALVGVDLASPGQHVAGILGKVHAPVNGEVEIQDGAVTHVSKYTDSAALLDVHAGGDSMAWVHVPTSWSEYTLSDHVVSGIYDYSIGGVYQKKVTLHSFNGSWFVNDLQPDILSRLALLEGVLGTLTG
jgi:hypothetical protein